VAGAADQREDDASCACFDSAPFSEPVEILGAPELSVVVAADEPTAFLVARLCDVAPDGGSRLVTYGARNLTHDDGHGRCRPIEAGRPIAVKLRLGDMAYSFPRGHRLRLALSNASWPLIWPSPAPVRITLFTERSSLSLPVRPPDPGDRLLRPFERPEKARSAEWTPETVARTERRVETDPTSGDLVTTLRTGFDASGRVALSRLEAAENIRGGDAMSVATRIHPQDPLRARFSIVQRTHLGRDSWSVDVDSSIDMSCTRDDFVVAATLAAREGGTLVFERAWDERVPRRGV
jgi:hypothetical protein